MSIATIIDNMGLLKKSFLRDVLQQLSNSHTIGTLYVPTLPGSKAYFEATSGPLADVYLHASHVPRTLEIARILEERGALVINSWSSTLICQDRKRMFSQMIDHGLPCPQTWFLEHFQDELSEELLAQLSFPLIMKCRYAYETLSVDKVDNPDQLKRLASYWGKQSVILQEYVESEGWDHRVSVIGKEIFVAKDRSPLDERKRDQFQIRPEELGKEAIAAILGIGSLFGLHIYRSDVLMTARGPMIVDVNSFPYFAGLVGPEKAMVDFVQRAIAFHKEKEAARSALFANPGGEAQPDASPSLFTSSY